MDTRDFIRVSVSGLGLRKTGKAPCSRSQQQQQQQPRQRQQRQQTGFCEIKLPGFSVQKAPVPVVKLSDGEPTRSLAASFYLDQHALDKLLSLPVSCLLVGASPACLELVLYMPSVTAAAGEDDMAVVGVLRLPVTSDWCDIRPGCSEVLHEGWVKVKQQPGDWEMHAVVRAELDPRYVLQFDGDVALSPRVIQVAGDGSCREQPVFSCKFTRDRLLRSSRGGLSGGDVTPGRVWDSGSNSTGNMDRKGWLVTIHDLSGSPVAAASMVTPFVPSSPGSDYVGSSNPGAWLILVPEQDHSSCWRSWGRLEAWRQRTGIIGLRLQLFGGGSGDAPQLVSEATMSMRKRGEFSIDTGELRRWSPPLSPVPTPQSSGDCSVYLGVATAEGFVMRCVMPKRGSGRSRRDGRGAGGRSTVVQLSTRHIGCVEDAAVYVALAAAVDLCRDACQSFARRLRKELAGPPY